MTTVTLVCDLDQEAQRVGLAGGLVHFLADTRERLPMFTVYDHPEDFPEHFVTRLSFTLPEHLTTGIVLRSSSLSTLRHFLAELGLAHLDRSPGDSPVIREVWL